MKPRRLPSGAWNCRVMIDGQSYSFTHADKKTVVRMASDFARRIIVPIEKAPQNAKYSALRGILLPAAGVEPAQCRRVYVRISESCQITFQSNKKERSISPAHMKNVCMQ